MTPLPAALEPGARLLAWRVDASVHAAQWDSGIGAEIAGGRWNPKGLRVVYASFDPSTTILESAVHRGFRVLDMQPFLLSCFAILNPSQLHVVRPEHVPNPAWLHGGIPSRGQQQFGAELLESHAFVAFPSVVSKASWNVVFRPDRVSSQYSLVEQRRLAIDTRLNPPDS